MSWSTRQIAELAGTSLRAVRHYHEVGLLPEPVRRSNGYKQYGVEHLVRLLRVKRLVDLGFSLAQIAELRDDEHPAEALRALDAHLAATVEQLQRARAELGVILHHHAPADLPSDLAPIAEIADLSTADRSMISVMSRFMSPDRRHALTEMLRGLPPDEADREFDALPADADEATRQDLAVRLVPTALRARAEHPAAMDPHRDARRGARSLAEVAVSAIQEFYNPAQVDVLRRLGTLLGPSST